MVLSGWKASRCKRSVVVGIAYMVMVVVSKRVMVGHWWCVRRGVKNFMGSVIIFLRVPCRTGGGTNFQMTVRERLECDN